MVKKAHGQAQPAHGPSDSAALTVMRLLCLTPKPVVVTGVRTARLSQGATVGERHRRQAGRQLGSCAAVAAVPAGTKQAAAHHWLVQIMRAWAAHLRWMSASLCCM